VQPPDEEGLLRASTILGNIASLAHTASGSFELDGSVSLVDAVVGIITRHPMQEKELIKTLQRWSPKEITTTLADLEKSGRAKIVKRYGKRFWSASKSYYPTKNDKKNN
jgi:hypothetical protein